MDADAQTVPYLRRPQALEAGMFLLLMGLPLAFFPPASLPFDDLKLLVLAVGTLLVLISGIPADGRLVVPALTWAGVLVLAAVTGVDPTRSLVGSIQAGGLAVLLCAAALVAIAPNVPSRLLARGRRWLVRTGFAVALVMVAARLEPFALDSLGRQIRFDGAAFGNPVFAIGFLSACIPAMLAERATLWRTILASAVLGAGFAVAQERSAWLLPAAALVAAAMFVRPGRRRIAVTGGTMALVVALWVFVPALAERGGPSGDFTAVGQFQTLKGERQRLALYEATVRGVARRPLLGWGPANTSSAFLASGTLAQVEQAGREWTDAHDLFLELAVTSGLIGLAAFGWLLLRLIPRTLRPAPARGWLAASAVTLGIYALFEPIDVTLTPLMLLLAGAAAGGRAPEPLTAPRTIRGARPAAAVMAGGLVVIALLNLSASVLESWGRARFDADWALRTSVDLAPWRLSATDALARNLAFEAGSAGVAEAEQARAIVLAAVRRHPLDPRVRLVAADVELLLSNLPGAQAWLVEQYRVFPGETITFPT